MKNEIDFFGESTLNSISKADKFNYWMYSLMKPYLKGKILEIGSGIGNISQFAIKENKKITLSDISINYVEKLKSNFPNNEILNIDLVHEDFDSRYKNIFGTFDFIFALNVIEHIEDDKKAIENIYKLLKKGGCVFILVPAYKLLFNNFDVALEHYRRYTKQNLRQLFPQFKLLKSFYFNFVGIFGWFMVGNLLGKKIIPESNMKLYNLLVPAFKIIDKIIFNKVGLSVIQIAQK